MAEKSVPGERINMGPLDRQAAEVAGGLLALYGLSRRSFRGLALTGLGALLFYRGRSGHCPVYEALGINTTGELEGEEVRVDHSVTIDRPIEEVFAYVRDFNHYGDLIPHLRSLTIAEGGRTHWVVTLADGVTLKWEAQVTNELPNELLQWHTMPGAPVEHEVAIHFRPAPPGRGTEVHAAINYRPPAGPIGNTLARPFSAISAKHLGDQMRRLKEILEAGEVAKAG